ncbi:MAG: hypothetical protein PHR77_05455, partial [Kiritimatiellae bacterium]|nr:hypothetical protein [Kiritimatiellia bacterium]
MTEFLKRKISWAKKSSSFLFIVLLALGLITAVIVTRAVDNDNDGMDDDYELFFGLDTSLDDSAMDPDGDGLTNLQEFQRGTDPFQSDTDRDGWNDDYDSNAVSRIYIKWGDSFFTTNNSYIYVAPPWLVSSYKVDGDWVTNSPSNWHVAPDVSNDIGSLHIEVDRTVLTNDLVVKLGFYDHTNASLYIDLYDTNSVIIATNLFGNLLNGSDMQVVTNLSIPLETYPDAIGIELRRGSGEITFYESLLYIDKDGDG